MLQALKCLLNNVSVSNSSGVFREIQLIQFAVGGENMLELLIILENMTSLSYGDSEIKIIFKDSNYTSNKTICNRNQGNFLEFLL